MLMKILLSIKPQYVEKIISGEKRYEFRKKEFKRRDIDTIVVYSSGNVKKLVGEIKFKRILSDTPYLIWKKTHAQSGMTEQSFMRYYMNKDKAYAIAIDSFHPYEEPMDIETKYPGVKAPQSYRYINETDF